MDRAEKRRGLHLVSKGHKQAKLSPGALVNPATGELIAEKVHRILVIPVGEGVGEHGIEVIKWDALPSGTSFTCSGKNRDEALKKLEEMSREMAEQFPGEVRDE